jgi:hypothetical protein
MRILYLLVLVRVFSPGSIGDGDNDEVALAE